MPNDVYCLAVPTKILVANNLINPNVPFTYTSITPSLLKQLFDIVQTYGSLKEKFGKTYSVEDDPDWQQIIMYGYFLDSDGKFLLYQRGTEKTYDDKRLAGKVSIGIGGHIEKQDKDPIESLYREFSEETLIYRDGNQIHPNKSGEFLPISELRMIFDLVPVALLKDQRDSVGKVHVGIVCRIVSKVTGVIVKTELDSGESAKSLYVTLNEYDDMCRNNEITPEGWTQLVADHELRTK